MQRVSVELVGLELAYGFGLLFGYGIVLAVLAVVAVAAHYQHGGCGHRKQSFFHRCMILMLLFTK